MAKNLFTPATKGGDYEKPEPGQYFARCFGMYDIGTQTITSAKFGTSQKRQIVLNFELLEDMNGTPAVREDGKPFTISQSFTWSMHSKAALRAFIGSWRGRQLTDEEANNFDVSVLVNQPALIQVVHNQSGENTYANIGTVMSSNKKLTGVNDDVVFSVEDPDDANNLDKLPQWVQEKARNSGEWGLSEVKRVFPETEEEEINVQDVQF